jgi:succinate-semialdehyde dehydrogenase/glutarate-semialdehyde dehydrogenase
MTYQTVNPATEEIVETFEHHTDAEAERALERASRVFTAWRATPVSRRVELLAKVADRLEARATDFARVMALEMGKPVAQGEAEVRKCAWACRYYVDNAERFLRPQPRESDASSSFVRFDPLGPTLAVMPWNFPFWQVFRFVAPTVAAGNAVLLKHSRSTPQCGVAIEGLMLESGLPEGLVQNLFLTHDQAARLIADERLRGVSLTGSSRGGKEIARVAGRNLKPIVLELGGSDPFIVLEDADLPDAVRTGVDARCLNSGQSCIAAKRFLIHRSRFNEFRDAFVAEMSARKVGDPMDREVHIGPLARRDLRDELVDQVQQSLDAGAKALCGGKTPSGKGFYYPPTVLVEVPESAPAAEEELFGPVAPLIPFDSDQEAVEIANSSRYGLGASLWTADAERARELIPHLEAGMVFVNGLVKSDPRLPFGGVKDSGFGRELSREGIFEFVNAKTVWIR